MKYKLYLKSCYHSAILNKTRQARHLSVNSISFNKGFFSIRQSCFVLKMFFFANTSYLNILFFKWMERKNANLQPKESYQPKYETMTYIKDFVEFSQVALQFFFVWRIKHFCITITLLDSGPSKFKQFQNLNWKQ